MALMGTIAVPTLTLFEEKQNKQNPQKMTKIPSKVIVEPIFHSRCDGNNFFITDHEIKRSHNINPNNTNLKII
jgi:hypothetical protein